MERRSIRQRKTVNYSQICEDDDSEDDFASKPPTKRTRSNKKLTSTQTQKEVKLDADLKPKGRLSRKEKLFNGELQQALDVSKVTSHQASNQLDEQLTSSNVRKDGDSDFSPDGEEGDSASSLSEDSDSEPQPKAKRRKTKSDTAIATTTKASATATKAQGNTAQTTPKPIVCSTTSLRPEATSKSTTSASLGAKRLPKWTPPARINPGSENVPTKTFSPTITSCGVIRVGLSRNARVKPLHRVNKPLS